MPFVIPVLNGVKLRGNVFDIGWPKGPGEGALSSLGDLRPVVGESCMTNGLFGICSMLDKDIDGCSYLKLGESSGKVNEPLKFRSCDLAGFGEARR